MPYINNIQPDEKELNVGSRKVGAELYPSLYSTPRRFNRVGFNQNVEVDESQTFVGAIPQKFNRQPYNRGVNQIGQAREVKSRLHITIADNPDYDNPDNYITDFVNQDEPVTIEHAFDERGTYYIEMYAENELGDVSETKEITLDVIILKYFLQNPQVKTQAPQANSVTVRSPAAEYTATTDPEPSNDELIERLVEIDEGDSSTCQAIAEELINKWGEEQRSVSGEINLTVNLDFKQKVQIVAPDNGIDEEMVVQKKKHDIANQKTMITCGDIILDDNELLTRILDDMKG